MLHLLNSLSEVFLPILYAMTTMAYGLAFFREDSLAQKFKSHLCLITFLTHTVYIGMYSVEFGRCMVTTPFEIMSLIAFTILTTYIFIEYRTKVKDTGFFFLSVAMVFELVSAVTVKVGGSGTPNEILQKVPIGLHVATAIFGLGAIAISAVYGLLYLFQYRELKRDAPGAFFRHLPSLEALERLCLNAAIIGFVFVTISIAIGVVTLPQAVESFSWHDPKLLFTGVMWLLYLGVLVAKYVLRMDGRKVVTLSLSGFAIAVFSMTIVNAFFGSFHNFF